ncbi:hypothetical protein A2154_04565 [Candidatus Gottesmanbacteria bacterium RBG_16_43_7]|uniref:DUF948 domain-containing protein n=1 Tax=Candidatus Gottesmanbacteria bacterium RBG_16_43_7 TaxID=1798373 RepID=A0A1F5ZBU8_9BACT|nr:MAG: hypothetical protein A2154_04565 [Candidatus Gottesmanbacteria bacterium RBG_16_43_7]
MDITQLVLIIISSTLAALLVILGIQVLFILKEIRISVQKVNKMLDDGGKVTGAISDSVVNVSGFVNGIRAGLAAITSLKSKGGKDE